MSVNSIVADKSNPDVPHGTTFTVFIRKETLLNHPDVIGMTEHRLCFLLALGNDHLTKGSIDEAEVEYSRHRTYGKGILEEASNWAKTTNRSAQDDITPSDGTGSDSSPDTGSTRSGDVAALFRFAPDDTILVVDDSK